MNNNLIATIITLSFLMCSNFQLLETLKSQDDWIIYKELPEGETVYKKPIENEDLKAFKISKAIEFDPLYIFDTVQDIDNYSKILVNSKLDSKVILETDSFIDGYNYIYIDNYFFSDRFYNFRMHRFDNSIEWYLIENSEKQTDAVYLEAGAGYWIFEKKNGINYITYSLYMDVGGHIPKFLDNQLNYNGILNVFRDVLNYSNNISISKAR